MCACLPCFLVCFWLFISFRNFTPPLAHAPSRARTQATERRPLTDAAPGPARRPRRASRVTLELAGTSVDNAD
eukprot:4717131-Pleurochrysis_carterae.AAC.1